MNARIILVPLDGSRRALSALPVARTLAALDGGSIRILHVGPRALPVPEMLELLGLTADDLQGAVLDARVGGADPSSEIIRAVKDTHCRAVVLCTCTAASGTDETLGRTALEVLLHVHVPVVLVQPQRGAHPWQLERILMAHDGTPAMRAGIVPAAELARMAKADLHVLHVAAVGALPPEDSGAMTTPRYMDQPQHEWPAWTQEFLDRIGSVSALDELRVRLFVGRGEPGAEIIRHARELESDLLVLAWKGRWQPARAETAKAVLRDAPCPVMVVRV